MGPTTPHCELLAPLGPALPFSPTRHDGFRILARRQGCGVRLITRNGHDLGGPLPARRRGRCGAAGAVLCDRWRGHRLRRQRLCGCSISSEVTAATRAILCAFDLLEVNGEDIRREPRSAKGGVAGVVDGKAGRTMIDGERTADPHARRWRYAPKESKLKQWRI
jgi:hypothetical protein